MAVKMIYAEYNKYSANPTELVKKYVMDSADDFSSLPKSAAGSTAMVADNGGKVYIVNASGEWEEM